MKKKLEYKQAIYILAISEQIKKYKHMVLAVFYT